MKKIVSLLLALSLLAGCTALLAGCGAPKDDGAHIAVYLGQTVYDFDPTDYYVDDNAEQVMSLLFEPLFTIDEKGKLVNAGAKKFTVDEEKNQVVIELRETYWSDSIRVRAADYIYAWNERILNPNVPNPAAPLFYQIENAAAAKSGDCSVSDVGAKATGIYELTLTYVEGTDVDRLLRNLASVATSPVRQDMVELSPTYWTKNVNAMVFNGPFKIRTYDEVSGQLSLSRNLGYHQDPSVKDYDNKVRPAELVGLTTAEGESIEFSYEDITSKVVFYMGDASLADRAANKKQADFVANNSTYTYVFNTENPLFADARVRLALSLALDRNAIASAVTFGKAANGFIPDEFGGAEESFISGSADPDKANQLLAAVDFTGLTKSFTLTIKNTEADNAIADLAIEAWAAIGFTVTKVYADPVSTAVASDTTITECGIQVLAKEASYGNLVEYTTDKYGQTQINYLYDVLAIDWQFYCDDPFVGLCAFSSSIGGWGVDFANSTARTNVSGWTSQDYDYLINALLKGDSQDYLVEAERLLCESAPVIPVLFNESFSFSGKKLKGVYADGNGNFVFTEAKQKNYQDYISDED